MNSEMLCSSIARSLPPLFSCSPAPEEGVRVRTPLMYPDGGVVDVFVLQRQRRLDDHRLRREPRLVADAVGEQAQIA